MGEKIGYARVSTREQNLSSQVDALNNAGCIRIFTDKISGKEFKREGLTACLDYLRLMILLLQTSKSKNNNNLLKSYYL